MNLPFLKSPHGADPVIVEGVFKASPARAFRAWTEPDELLKWFSPGEFRLETADVDLKEGGAWRFAYGESDGKTDCLKGSYVEVKPGERLVFTWVHERIFSDGRVETTPESLVTITFEPCDGGAHVRLVHEQIIKEDGRLGVGGGWNGCFTNLETWLAA